MYKKKLAGIVFVVAAVAVLSGAGTAGAAPKKIAVSQIAVPRRGPGGPGFHPAPPPPRPGGPGGPGFRPAPPPPPHGHRPPPPPPPPRYHRHRDRDDLFVVGGAMLLLGAILGGAN